MLDDTGLKVAGTHTAFNLLQGDELPKTIDIMKTIGNKNVIVPSMPAQYRKSIDGWKEAGQAFNEIHEKIKRHGLVLGYHNHTVEFEKPAGATETPFDVFFSTAVPAVKVQLDIGHCRRAGADPVEVIRKYKGRIISVHIKEYSPDKPEPALGEGVIQWKEVFGELEKQGKTEWYIVEEEGKSCKEFECIAGAIERLHKMGK
jgi:sugar phosphate isomerase/epimerase